MYRPQKLNIVLICPQTLLLFVTVPSLCVVVLRRPDDGVFNVCICVWFFLLARVVFPFSLSCTAKFPFLARELLFCLTPLSALTRILRPARSDVRIQGRPGAQNHPRESHKAPVVHVSNLDREGGMPFAGIYCNV
jgi:hypothetical protein